MCGLTWHCCIGLKQENFLKYLLSRSHIEKMLDG